jgi:hypothetical protein
MRRNCAIARMGPGQGFDEWHDMDPWLQFVIASLACWRVTHLLASEDGPADLIVRFRARLGQSIVGKLMDCFNCLSLLIAAPAALLLAPKPLDWFLAWLALSGAACLLEQAVQKPVFIQPVPESSPGDSKDGMLRSETSSADKRPGDAVYPT